MRDGMSTTRMNVPGVLHEMNMVHVVEHGACVVVVVVIS